jgi:NADH:ubiquinone oxidoreductase subunit H
MKIFLYAVFFFNIIAICGYLVLNYLKKVLITDMNFTLLILFGISTNIVIGELILKHNAIYGENAKNKYK